MSTRARSIRYLKLHAWLMSNEHSVIRKSSLFRFYEGTL
jgi:hypothetical protein